MEQAEMALADKEVYTKTLTEYNLWDI